MCEELTGGSGDGTKSWTEESASREWESASGRHNGPKSDEGWTRGRLVGALMKSSDRSLLGRG